jgi:hypothetical protein
MRQTVCRCADSPGQARHGGLSVAVPTVVGSHKEGVVTVIIDCTSCPVRELSCGDCMVTALLEPPTAEVPLDSSERAAVTLFVASGLVTAQEASGLRARREPWDGARAVG